MNPENVFCPHESCVARGHLGKGNILIHSRQEKRYKCKECGKTFSATKGTPLSRLHKPVETMILVLTLLAHGCPLQAIVEAFGLDERTVSDWQKKADSTAKPFTRNWLNNPAPSSRFSPMKSD